MNESHLLYDVHGAEVISASFGVSSSVKPHLIDQLTHWTHRGAALPATDYQVPWDAVNSNFAIDLGSVLPTMQDRSWCGYTLQLYPLPTVQVLSEYFTISAYARSLNSNTGAVTPSLVHSVRLKVSRAVHLVSFTCMNVFLGGELALFANLVEPRVAANPPVDGLVVSGPTNFDFLMFMRPLGCGNATSDEYLRRLHAINPIPHSLGSTRKGWHHA